MCGPSSSPCKRLMTMDTTQIGNRAWSFAHVLRDEGLEDGDSLPEPDVLATEIADDLTAALEQFGSIANTLEE